MSPRLAPPSPHLLDLLYRALASPHGICVSVESFEGAKTELNLCRAAAMDEKLSVLSFVPSPRNPKELWIVKRSVLPIDLE